MSWPLLRDVVINHQWLFKEKDGAIAYRVLEVMAIITKDDTPPLYYGGRKQIAIILGIRERRVADGFAVLDKHGLIRRVGQHVRNGNDRPRRTVTWELCITPFAP